MRKKLLVPLVLAVLGLASHGADLPKVPVPSSPFLAVVYRYADTMLEHGRDIYGPQQTGLFCSALDRKTLAPLTNRPAPPAGIREGDRVGRPSAPLMGANPQHDENLLRLLYTLSELSGNRKYRAAAEAELRWFLQNAASPATGLLAWGEHLCWDVLADKPMASQSADVGAHEFFRPWVLWDRCFELAPEESRRFALALWEHQIADPKSGAFNRHAGFWKHEAAGDMDFARHAGFYIRTWGAAYANTKDPLFLEAIEVLLARFEKKRHPQTGLIELRTGQPTASPALTLSLAIDCDGTAGRIPEPLAGRLRAFATREDEIFCTLPHDLAAKGGPAAAKRGGGGPAAPKQGGGGFITSLDKATGKPAEDRTSLWEGRYGDFTTAQVGMMCVARYDNTGNAVWRGLITNAANAYLRSAPDAAADVWPMTLAHAISLQLAAWRDTARPEYFNRARDLGTLAVEKIWQDNPLPAASFKSSHYETITGADSLALALIELHLQILHITAVQCPPNTIDR